MSFRFKRLLAFLPGQSEVPDTDITSRKTRRSSAASTQQATSRVAGDAPHQFLSTQDSSGSLSKSVSAETLKPPSSPLQHDVQDLKTSPTQSPRITSLPSYEEPQTVDDDVQLCQSPSSDDADMDWSSSPLKIDTSVPSRHEKTEQTPKASEARPLTLTHAPVQDERSLHGQSFRARRPTVDRLPSEAISISSCTESNPSLPSTPLHAPDPHPRNKAIGHSPLIPQSSSPEAMEVDDSSPTIPRKRRVPQFSISHHHTQSEEESSDVMDLAPAMSRSSSRLSQVSAPSTPTGFKQHRASTSAAGRPSEIKETLDAHLRHASHASSHISDRDGGDDDETSGLRLNQYTLGETLGKGSAGIVKLATDDEGRQYAVKEFSKSMLRRRKKSEMLKRNRRRPVTPGQSLIPLDDDPEKSDALALIRGEVAVMKKLDHPNLVRLIEVLNVPESDSLYMVLELCSGGPLTHVSLDATNETADKFKGKVDTTPASEESARNYFRQIILGVEYLHANDIVHRDIKPENILLMEDRIVCKIVDFGVSEMFIKHGDDLSTRTVGSPAFMSPELCSSHHNAGIHARATDIWAMGNLFSHIFKVEFERTSDFVDQGVTLFCLVTGRLPFQSSNFLELNDLIQEAAFDVPRHLSEELAHLLHRLLEKDPGRRITMDELRADAWVTQSGLQPLPSKDDNLNIIEEPTHTEVQSAVGMGQILSDIISAVKVSKALKRMANEKMKAKRGMSLQSGHSDESHSALKNLIDDILPSSPSPPSSSPSYTPSGSKAHGRHPSLSVDDNFLDSVRFVEQQTQRDVIRRDDDLSLASHHRRSLSRSSKAETEGT